MMKKTISILNRGGTERNSAIELLKISAMVLIVISHVLQTLSYPNGNVLPQEYVVNLHQSTMKPQQFILSLLRYTGVLGNLIFFVSSAWFLVDKKTVNKKKLFQMLTDIWAVSVLILVCVFCLRRGDIPLRTIYWQFFPTTYQNNWYMTCYILLYAIHPFLNTIIFNMKQRTHLRCVLILLVLYEGIDFFQEGLFFSSELIVFITIYFLIAYLKTYNTETLTSKKRNICLILFGILGNFGMVALTNLIGMYAGAFSDQLMRWNILCNPFLLCVAIGAFNLARTVVFFDKRINYISSLSMLVYIIHENRLLRNYYRPLLWDYVYNTFGYDHILVWVFILSAIVFAFGILTSIFYKETLRKIVLKKSEKLYVILSNYENKFEAFLINKR